MADGEIIYEIRGDDSSLESDIASANDKAEKKVSAGAEKLKSIAGGTAKAIGAGFVAAGTAAVAMGAAATNSAVDMSKAMNSFTASTGLSAEAAERYRDILEDVYKNNYGESFEDIAGAMTQIRQQIGPVVDGWDDAGIREFTESAFALRDALGYDIQESVRAADTMMTQFGIDGAEAMNLIAAGAQNDLDFSGEMLDSINEYSVQFAKMGLDARDMFQIFQTGADAGAWNLDKIGDAVKEMSIRVIDGSDSTAEGFNLIGLNADEMAGKFAKGGESAKTAFQETIKALAEMKDPLAQNTAGVDLFGTMWEDLGPEVVTQLAEIKNAAYGTGEELDKIKDVKYNDLGSMFEGLKRSVEMLLLPLGKELIPLLTELIKGTLPLIEECLPPLIDMVSEFAASLLPIAKELLPVIMELIQAFMPSLTQIMQEILPPLVKLISEIAPLLGDLVSQVLPIFTELLQMLLPPLLEIIKALLPPLIELLSALMPIFELIISLLQPIINLFMELLEPIVSLISDALTPLIETLTPLINEVLVLLMKQLQTVLNVFTEVFKGISELVKEQVGNLIDIFENLIDFVSNIFAGNWEAAWENIKNIFKAIADSLGGIFKAPINFIIDCINGFLRGLNGIEIPDWIPGIGGKSFSIGLIPRLKKGMDFVPNDYFPAYLDYGERVLTQTQNIRFNALGGLDGMERALSIDGNLSAEPKVILGKGCIIVRSEMDGKIVGETLAPYIDTELGTMESQKERGG